jgi:cell wall-associated NlpC family hydrolase
MSPLALVAAAGAAASTATAIGVDTNQSCAISGPVPGLNAAQAANAEQIVTATFAISAESALAARIALMTAYTESGLTNLGPEGGNDGSLGLFQQRAVEGWGTPAEEMNPTDATDMFVQRLLAVPGWQTLPPWVAAQDVQRSAFSDGSNYQTHWAAAGTYLTSVVGDANLSGGCGQGIPAGVTGPDHGLPAGYAIPDGTGPAHAQAVKYALEQLGKPYVWGAAGPAAFDCSGLTMAAWATAGVQLEHYTGDQQQEGVAVTPAALTPGDLVLIPGSDSPGPGIAGHVGIYLGFGLVLSAIDPQEGIAVQTYQVFVSGGLIALRDPDPADD